MAASLNTNVADKRKRSAGAHASLRASEIKMSKTKKPACGLLMEWLRQSKPCGGAASRNQGQRTRKCYVAMARGPH